MRLEYLPMAVRILGRLLVMIVAILTLAVDCGGAATTQPTFAEQQPTTDSPLITPSQAPQAPPTQAPTPSVESPKVKLEKHSQA